MDETKAQNAFEWWRDRWWAYDHSQGYDAYDNRGVAFPVINVNSSWNSYCDSGLLCNEIVMPCMEQKVDSMARRLL